MARSANSPIMTPQNAGASESENGEEEPSGKPLQRGDHPTSRDARVDEIARLADHALTAQLFEWQQAPNVAHNRVGVTQEEEQSNQSHHQLKEQDRNVGEQSADASSNEPSSPRDDVLDEAPEVD